MNDKNRISPPGALPESHGMTVPDGYFEDFGRRMMERIPTEVPVQESEVLPRSIWDRIRPYVYLAAMFAGVWLMMNIFSFAGAGTKSPAPSQTGGELLAELVSGSESSYLDDYVSMSDYDLYNDLYESGYEIPSKY